MGDNDVNADSMQQPPVEDISDRTIAELVGQLVRESIGAWNEQSDPRADVIAVRYRTVLHVALLSGTSGFLLVQGLSFGTNWTQTVDRIERARELATELWAAEHANQTVLIAARKTPAARSAQNEAADEAELERFEKALRSSTWATMQRLAEGSAAYIAHTCMAAYDSEPAVRAEREFISLSPMEKVALLAMRTRDATNEYSLAPDELAGLAGVRANSVIESRSRAQKKLRKCRTQQTRRP